MVRQKADKDFVTGSSYPIQAPSSTLTRNGLRTGDWTWVAHNTSHFIPKSFSAYRKPSGTSLCQGQT
ncbi:hypothetical protein N7499_002437 [Penicillium canescens]|uniref:Uncharacterized protein n=2 Tax=Penicillium canescens TaxID=5083 RepID=A0AAD6I8A7_PENCN|nr:hypothetical protein N7460_009394 [Penicillium canescens]KAJ6098063.1 hypothetical protein N7499_002437 [Penicillium canescens]